MGRIAIFIDGGYLEKITQNEFTGAKIDFGKLSSNMSENYSLLRTYYYNCLPYQGNPPTKDESHRFAAKQRFFYALDRIDRFEVRLGRLAFRGVDSSNNPIFVQKGVDVLMAIDLVQLSVKHLISYAAILAADADFIPAIKVAKDEGVLIKLYHSCNIGKNHELWDCADERKVIDHQFITSIESS